MRRAVEVFGIPGAEPVKVALSIIWGSSRSKTLRLKPIRRRPETVRMSTKPGAEERSTLRELFSWLGPRCIITVLEAEPPHPLVCRVPHTRELTAWVVAPLVAAYSGQPTARSLGIARRAEMPPTWTLLFTEESLPEAAFTTAEQMPS